MVWEDDAHVLAVVAQKLDWGVIRVGLDGSVELADERIHPARNWSRSRTGSPSSPDCAWETFE